MPATTFYYIKIIVRNAWIWCRIPSRLPKCQNLTFFSEKFQKSNSKTFYRKVILFNFVNLSVNFCPRFDLASYHKELVDQKAT